MTQMNGCGGAISVTEQSCAAPISKVKSHITGRFYAILWCSVLIYSHRRVGAMTGTHWAGSILPLQQAVNIQEWGLEISAPSPFGLPSQHVVWYVWRPCAPRPLTVHTIYEIAFRGTKKSFPVSHIVWTSFWGEFDIKGWLRRPTMRSAAADQ